MSEEMVTQKRAQELLQTGLEMMTALFVCAYRRLSERLGAEEARRLLRDAMYEAAAGLGREMAAKVSRRDALGMKESWEILYGIGTEGIEEATPDRFVFSGSFCCSFELMKRWGLSAEEINKLSDCFCIADAAFVEGFNPAMKFEHTARLMKGDAGCRWVHQIEVSPGPEGEEARGRA